MPHAWSRISRVRVIRSPARFVAKAAKRTAAVSAELLDAFGIVAGWGLVTFALSSYFGIWELWPLSIGLFALSLVGWKHLGTLFTIGMYTLTRAPKKKGPS